MGCPASILMPRRSINVPKLNYEYTSACIPQDYRRDNPCTLCLGIIHIKNKLCEMHNYYESGIITGAALFIIHGLAVPGGNHLCFCILIFLISYLPIKCNSVSYFYRFFKPLKSFFCCTILWIYLKKAPRKRMNEQLMKKMFYVWMLFISRPVLSLFNTF